MKRSTILSVSGLIGVSMLTLGVLGISHADASHLSRGGWRNLTPQERQQRVERWKDNHPHRAEVMEKLLEYLELDEDALRELHENKVTLKEYVEQNGYDMETVESILREGMVAHLDELKAEGVLDEDLYQERLDQVDERVEQVLDGMNRRAQRLHRIAERSSNW